MNWFVALLLMWGAADPPEPDWSWQIPLSPIEKAALDRDGRVWVSTGKILALFDHPSDIIEQMSLDSPPTSLLALDSMLILITSQGRFVGVDHHMNRLWSRQIGIPGCPPLIDEGDLVIPSGRILRKIDLKDGRTHQALLVKASIKGLRIFDSELCYTLSDGTNGYWRADHAQPRTFILNEGPLDFATSTPKGLVALCTQSRELQVFRANGWLEWKRTMSHDISFAPLWLEVEGDLKLAVVTEGRSIFIFDHKGLESQRQVMQDRPLDMTPLGSNRFLVAHQETNALVWYAHGDFFTQPVPQRITHLLSAPGLVGTIDVQGQVRIYKTQTLNHISPQDSSSDPPHP